MSEQEADSSENSRRTLLYHYHHKRVKTSNGCIKTYAGKFISFDFFGSAYPSNQQLQQTKDKLRSTRKEVMTRKFQRMIELMRFIKENIAGKVECEQFRKRSALDIVEKYIIEKQEVEVKKLEEDLDKITKAMMHTPLPLSPPPPPSQPAVAVAVAEARTPQPPPEITPPLLGG